MKRTLSIILAFIMINANIPVGIIKISADNQTNAFSIWDEIRASKILSVSQNYKSEDGILSKQSINKNLKQTQNLETKLNEYILKFKDDITFEEIQALISPYIYDLIGNSKHKLFTIKTDSIERLKKDFEGKYIYIEKNGVSKTQTATNDPYLNDQWALETTNITDAWTVSRGSSNVLVAVIDSGVDREHEDLTSADIRNGWDYVYDEYVYRDSCGHGTNVTGIIAATPNNGVGISGVCWNVAILPLLVLNHDGYANTSDICEALYDAADAGADVINLSLGSNEYENSENDAIAYAASAGCIIVASAGNEGTSDYTYPASYDGVVSVASINNALNSSDFSNQNDYVDVSAPGEDIRTTCDYYYDDAYYINVSGTSFSSPYVAGIAALVRSCDDNIDTYDFHKILKYTSADRGEVGYDNIFGFGIIDADKIMTYIRRAHRNSNYIYTISIADATAKIIEYTGSGGVVSIPEKIEGCTVTTIGNYAFDACKTLTGLTISDKVTSVGFDTFQYCTNLKTISIGRGITSIPDSMFYGCKSLTSVTIPSSITAIGKWAFGECTSLTGITIPDSVKYIGPMAYIGCAGLTNVTFGKSVSFIDYSAFYECSKLVKAKFLGNAPEMYINDNNICDVFDLCASNFIVYFDISKTGFSNPWYGHRIVAYSTSFTPETPTYTKASSLSYNNIKLSWKIVPGVTGYIIYRFNSTKKYYESIGHTNSLSYIDSNVSTGKEYQYKIASYKTINEFNIFGLTTTMFTGRAIPSTPSSFKAVRASITSIKISWGTVTGASGYVVYRYKTAEQAYVRVKVTTLTSWINTDLNPGVNYYYKVIAYHTENKTNIYGNPSNKVSART